MEREREGKRNGTLKSAVTKFAKGKPTEEETDDEDEVVENEV